MKNVFICIWIVLSYMPFLTGNDHIDTSKIVNISSLESRIMLTKPEVNNNIERLLLRSVKLNEKNTVIANRESANLLFKPETEQNIEGITSILSAEKKKLNELEDEYKKLEKELIKSVDTKNYDLSDLRQNELSSESFSADKLTTIKNSVEGTTSSLLEKRYPMKNAVSRISETRDQQCIIKDKQAETEISEDLNLRLSKVIGNWRLLDLAECLYKLGEYNNALQTYKLITSSDVSLDQYMWVQYQIANCYRNMREFDLAVSEYQRFIDQNPNGDLIEPAKWYIDDVNWWKTWYEKNTLNNSHNLELSKNLKFK